jgi:Txe/YoeB family toxin of Txe-Axe toxin-antitoxin module
MKKEIVVLNHKWKDGSCVNCGIKRKRMTFKEMVKKLKHPPFEIYKSYSKWHYLVNNQWTISRPQC